MPSSRSLSPPSRRSSSPEGVAEIKTKLAIIFAKLIILTATSMHFFLPGGLDARAIQKSPSPAPSSGANDEIDAPPQYFARNVLFSAWIFLNDLSIYASVLVIFIELGVASICKLFGMQVEAKNRYHKITWRYTFFTIYAFVIGFLSLMLSSAHYEVVVAQTTTTIGTLALIVATGKMTRLASNSFRNAPPRSARPRVAASTIEMTGFGM